MNRALTPAQLIDHSEVRARIQLAVAGARRAGFTRLVVEALVAQAFAEAEQLERGAVAAVAAGPGERRGPRRGPPRGGRG